MSSSLRVDIPSPTGVISPVTEEASSFTSPRQWITQSPEVQDLYRRSLAHMTASSSASSFSSIKSPSTGNLWGLRFDRALETYDFKELRNLLTSPRVRNLEKLPYDLASHVEACDFYMKAKFPKRKIDVVTSQTAKSPSPIDTLLFLTPEEVQQKIEEKVFWEITPGTIGYISSTHPENPSIYARSSKGNELIMIGRGVGPDGEVIASFVRTIDLTKPDQVIDLLNKITQAEGMMQRSPSGMKALGKIELFSVGSNATAMGVELDPKVQRNAWDRIQIRIQAFEKRFGWPIQHTDYLNPYHVEYSPEGKIPEFTKVFQAVGFSFVAGVDKRGAIFLSMDGLLPEYQEEQLSGLAVVLEGDGTKEQKMRKEALKSVACQDAGFRQTLFTALKTLYVSGRLASSKEQSEEAKSSE